jgi:protein-disulfide isomerase
MIINSEFTMNKLTQLTKNDHVRGNRDAPVTLLEYGDYECPYCGRAYIILEKLYQSAGDMYKFAFRNFPLTQIHPHALQAAAAAEAAALQKKFWEMHDILYEHQDMLEERDLVNYAEVLGLNIEKFVLDMGSPKVERKIRSDFMSGVRCGVNGTPTFFINGHRHEGSYELDDLLAAIQQAAAEGGAYEKRTA